MARRTEAEHEAGNDSSFLDVITNCVGILIILVIVVGQRAKNAPLVQSAREAAAKLATARAETGSMEEDTAEIARQLAIVQSEVGSRARERGEVNALVTVLEGRMAERRAALDEKSRGRFDTQRELAMVAAELNRVEVERQQIALPAEPKTIEIESFPTPIGKTVEGKEAHFQLLGGRLAYVPLDVFKDKLYDRLREHARNSDRDAEIVDTLGPVGGFRLRYTLEKFETPRGIVAQVAHLEMLPVSSQLGEPIDAALAKKSQFRDKLEMMSPRQFTITVWTYSDSFAEYRRLKKELYSMGYPVAARPLLPGMPIAASPQGSKSSSE
jgi:hypothetical protein